MLEKPLKVPELLVPAGSLEKLKVAVDYGADAIYLAGLKFGLRAAADNFTETELDEGIRYAHEREVKVYLVLNGFLHDKDLSELPDFLKYIEKIGVDAVIVSDLGVIETVKNHSNLEIHLSTQASCLNAQSAKFWKNFGVTRIVVGREVSLSEVKDIKAKVDIEIEMFIHGSMCMAYSGNCTISNYTQGRDSNRGGCAHSCRFQYSLEQNDQKLSSFFMSSKDLNGLSLIEEFSKAGVDSVKVEGRMKSHLYAGTVAKVYSEALNEFKNTGKLEAQRISFWQNELKKFTHREYAEVNLIEKAGADTVYFERENENNYGMLGRVLEVKDEYFVMQVRHAFEVGHSLEILPFKGSPIKLDIQNMSSLTNEPIERTKPSTLVKIPLPRERVVEANYLIRGFK
ncbi:MAG: peptidase U32 [Halobacteriovoraceae bacterium]|nr:peptidase U32 [Halobacteriovoraceae bacterium]